VAAASGALRAALDRRSRGAWCCGCRAVASHAEDSAICRPRSSSRSCSASGLRFRCDPVRGQKTSFLDQRQNRARVGELARGGAC
jgi:hypothetical protein